MIVLIFNCFSVLIGTWILNYFGRKSIMVFTYFAMAILLGMMTVSANNEWGYTELVATILYLVMFEVGPGAITWFFMSEITADVGTSVATLIHWIFVLLVGALLPIMFNVLFGNWTFTIFAGLCLIAATFISIFVKETKGLSEQEISRIYCSF